MTLLPRVEVARPRLLDGYIVREMVPPTAIGLLVFTFVLLIDQIPRLLAVLVARSADFATIVRVFVNLLPSILAVTMPMAFLLGVLLAFGRMASDSEIIALRAVGVSPSRLVAPVIMMAALMTSLTFYINAVALPAANQAHRQLVFNLIVSKARTDVRPRTFTDDFSIEGLRGRSRMSVGYRFVANSALEEINGGLLLRLTKRYYGAFEARYDNLAKKFLEIGGGIRVISDCECWVIDIGLSNRVNPNETQARVLVSLVGLGQVGREPFRRTFGAISGPARSALGQ
jgi:hypothetical protein